VFNNNKIENKIENNKDNNKDNKTDNNIEPNNYNKLYKCIKLFIIACIVWKFFGVTAATAFGEKVVKSESNSKEVSSSESSGSGFNLSASKEGNAYIPSILEDELSPLQ
jgi:hypothetical protein